MEIEILLKKHQKSITPERKKLATWMQDQHLFTASQLMEKFCEVSRASVFRNLKLFCEIGYLRSTITGDNKELSYQLVHAHNHEHLHCTDCGKFTCLNSDDIYAKISESAEKMGFQISSQSLSISGSCKNCL